MSSSNKEALELLWNDIILDAAPVMGLLVSVGLLVDILKEKGLLSKKEANFVLDSGTSVASLMARMFLDAYEKNPLAKKKIDDKFGPENIKDLLELITKKAFGDGVFGD